ncbi:hypothetical protein KSP40_PGU008050 [Platanthera guangdongensis]|uniref:Uncharacterized protein n=1 Tax=Platanthera guangdongensis TaxID=2320717 RepID=A0ABR2N1L9_9ASPA
MLGVGDEITDDVLKKDLEHAMGLLVDHATDALNAASASKAADRRLRDALVVVAEDFAMVLGPSLSEPLASLSTPRHCRCSLWIPS